ncbi:MAG: hypothetical protein DRR42_01805 [Gammaproteobacteria bacterium]|nr:MAG: hypothetical protein DRR42_01805 [Gammaproteobacteria bacterium]
MLTADLVTMSAQELDRLTVIERVLQKRLSQVEASKQLGMTPRQVRRLIGCDLRDGARWPRVQEARHARQPSLSGGR